MPEYTEDTDLKNMPIEAPEGVELDGKLLLSKTNISVMDLLGEGPMALVSGDYNFQGTLGNIGWDSYSFTPFLTPSGFENSPWLRSVYWNEIPIVNSDGRLNFQQVSVQWTEGTSNGIILDSGTPRLTISRNIGERLRGSDVVLRSADDNDNTDDKIVGQTSYSSDDFAKVYKIFNKYCSAVYVNVKVQQLFRQVNIGDVDEYGEEASENFVEKFRGYVLTSFVEYSIYSRPIYSTYRDPTKIPQFALRKKERIEGKISYGYVRQTRINFYESTTAERYYNDPNFLGWEIRIVRTTPESLRNALRNQTYVDSITEIYDNKFLYPNSCIIKQDFDAEFFSEVPRRAFDIQGLKTYLPKNYDPILKRYATTGEGTSNGGWNGEFKDIKEWTDNPAWCFYDLLSNNRYGLGEYLNEELTDVANNKFLIYQIARNCDQLVYDEFGNLEPRFTCNLVINSRQQAYQLLNDFASIFRGLLYYEGGQIIPVQDVAKEPILYFTNANVREGNFIYTSSSKRARHTVAMIRYNDKKDFYKPSIEYVEDFESIRKYGVREVELAAFGCTSRGQAIRLGRWALASAALETESIQFTVGLEGTYLKPGDVFGVYDNNRKAIRSAGRTLHVTNMAQSGMVYLDGLVSLSSGIQYKLVLDAPTYYYDVSNTQLSNSNQVSGVRKQFVKEFYFSGWQADVVRGKSRINLTGTIDNVNNFLSGHQIWMITNPTPSGIFEDYTGNFIKEYDLYRVLNVSESDDELGQYIIDGLQYALQKYSIIESGIAPQKRAELQNIEPLSVLPSSVIVSSPPRSAMGSHAIRTSVVSETTPSGTTHYKLFLSKDSYFPTTGQPDASYLAAIIPAKEYVSNVIPANQVGTYYYRLYSYNAKNDITSTQYASGSVSITGRLPIENVIISSLNFEGPNIVNYNVDSKNLATGIYNISNPTFVWAVGGQPDSVIQANPYFRVSIREPAYSFVPSNTVYAQYSGLRFFDNDYKFIFDIFKNAAISGGPFRDYDIVVEAHDASGFTSAGNRIGVTEDNWSSNPDGYDIFSVKNTKFTGYYLNSGEFKTSHWIDGGGSINIYYDSGELPTSIVGGEVYFSTGTFDTLYIQTGGEFYESINRFDYNPMDRGNRITVPSFYRDIKTGYVAVAFFDQFDVMSINQGVSPTRYFTNVTTIEASGEYKYVNVNKEIKINHENDFGKNYKIRTEYITGATGNYVTLMGTDFNGDNFILATKLV